MPQVVLGVDGGNTKTDYLLFDLAGNFIDGIRLGTCSHEGLPDGFDGAYRVMKESINQLLKRNNLKISDVHSAAFGLAGVDMPSQKKRLEGIIAKIGFKHFVVNNDGFLGIKATSPTGVGVCSINGTGTVTVGLDETGKMQQVGGVGYLSGDEAGGAYLTRRVFQGVYDELFRVGSPTSLTKAVFSLLSITDKDDYLPILIDKINSRQIDRTEIIKLLFAHGNSGDVVAQEILRQAGISMGRSVAGCIGNLHFEKAVPVVLAGSVWANATCPVMYEAFSEFVEANTNVPVEYHILTAPPVCGAILWALEIAHQKVPSPELKTKVLAQVENYQKSCR